MNIDRPSVLPVDPRGPGDSRYHHLDAVRSFALLLGVLFHAAESFGPNNHYWAVVDCSPFQGLEDIRFACHSFRLELFFIIAGFFARLLLKRRGTRAFVANRAVRILVPFVVGWAVLYPALVYIWLWGQSVSGTLTQFGVPAEAQQLAVWKLWLGFFFTLGFLSKFDLTHLWFLHQLLAVYVVFLTVYAAQRRCDLTGSFMRTIDRAFARVIQSPFAVTALAIACYPTLLLMRNWGVDTPKSSLVPELPCTLLFSFCFGVGWLLHRQPSLTNHVAQRWLLYLVLGVGFWLSFQLFEVFGAYQFARKHPWMVRLPWTVLYTHMMWAFALGFLGLFTRFCYRPSSWSRYLADSSYWVYLAHLPLVVALQVAFGRIPWPWFIKYPLIVLISTLLLYLSYHYLVRATWLGVILNGRRYPLKWPWAAETTYAADDRKPESVTAPSAPPYTT